MKPWIDPLCDNQWRGMLACAMQPNWVSHHLETLLQHFKVLNLKWDAKKHRHRMFYFILNSNIERIIALEEKKKKKKTGTFEDYYNHWIVAYWWVGNRQTTLTPLRQLAPSGLRVVRFRPSQSRLCCLGAGMTAPLSAPFQAAYSLQSTRLTPSHHTGLNERLDPHLQRLTSLSEGRTS